MSLHFNSSLSEGLFRRFAACFKSKLLKLSFGGLGLLEANRGKLLVYAQIRLPVERDLNL
jgi:hypothetical protein